MCFQSCPLLKLPELPTASYIKMSGIPTFVLIISALN